MIDLSILIVNFNGEKDLVPCLQSIYDQTRKASFEIILIDNHSTDNSVKLATERFNKIQIIQNQKRGRLHAAQAGFLPPHAGYRTPSGAKETRKVEKKNVFVEALEQLEQDSNRQVGFARAGAAHE